MEVYSVDEVTGVDPISATVDGIPALLLVPARHAVWRTSQTFWYASRRPSLRPTDRGTDVYLSLVDLCFDPRLPAESTLVVRTTCTNRELPLDPPAGRRTARARARGRGPARPDPLPAGPRRPPLRPPLRRGLYWRLVSHLCLNHLSHLARGRGPRRAPGDPPAVRLLRSGGGQVGRSGHPPPDRRDRLGDQPQGDRQAARGRRQLLPRHRDHDRVRRGEVRRHRGLPVRLRARAIPRRSTRRSTRSPSSSPGPRKSATPFKTWPPRAGEQPLV